MRPVPATAVGLVKRFEGNHGTFEATRTLDPVGNWEIGWSHKLSGPQDPLWSATLDADQADALALSDLTGAATDLYLDLGPAVVAALTDGQWAALIDFTYNEGVGNFRASTLRHFITLGDYASAADEFPKWIYANKKPLAGLVTRRGAERALFVS